VAAEIGRLRGLIAELRPAALDQLGLGPALRTLVAATGDLHALDARASVDDDGPDRLPDQLETAVYRIVQEALANAVRHAGAHRVDVRLRRSPETVIVTVTDDGDGFDPAAPVPGFGLAGMRERATLAGGTLDVTSGGDGTTVTAAFSLDQRSTSPLSSA
jgi:signal transduction histidine kinase